MSIGDGDILGKAVSEFGAVVGLSIENAKVFEEIVFAISKRIIAPANGGTPGDNPLYIVFDPTLCICQNLVFLPVFFEGFGAGPLFIDLFIDPVFTGGDPIPSVNRDFTSSETSPSVWTLAPTVSDEGARSPLEFTVFSNGTAAVAKAGGSSKGDLVTNIDITKKYMFKIMNQENTAADGIIASTWFEVPA